MNQITILYISSFQNGAIWDIRRVYQIHPHGHLVELWWANDSISWFITQFNTANHQDGFNQYSVYSSSYSQPYAA